MILKFTRFVERLTLRSCWTTDNIEVQIEVLKTEARRDSEPWLLKMTKVWVISVSDQKDYHCWISCLRLTFDLPTIITALLLHHTINFLNPTNTILSVLLNPRLQERLMQMKIIHLTNPHDCLPRKARRDAVHQTSTDAAEMVGHRMAALDFLDHGEFRDFVLSADIGQGFVFDDEVGGEHGGGDLAIVGAVADKLTMCEAVFLDEKERLGLTAATKLSPSSDNATWTAPQ